MGYLIYDGRDYDFEDRLLAHLKVAIGKKFRKQESFFLSWNVEAGNGSGRVSLWMNPGQHVGFRFAGSREPELSKTWVKALVELSATHRGLVAISEKQAEAYMREKQESGS